MCKKRTTVKATMAVSTASPVVNQSVTTSLSGNQAEKTFFATSVTCSDEFVCCARFTEHASASASQTPGVLSTRRIDQCSAPVNTLAAAGVDGSVDGDSLGLLELFELLPIASTSRSISESSCRQTCQLRLPRNLFSATTNEIKLRRFYTANRIHSLGEAKDMT